MIKDFDFTNNFTFYEMTNSTDYPHLVPMNRINLIQNEGKRDSMRKLCETILQPLRDYLGVKIKILSGYRNFNLNGALGGSRYSQHMKGEAADIYFQGIEAKVIRDQIISYLELNNIKWHQFIYYSESHFIHISLSTGVNDNQVLEFEK